MAWDELDRSFDPDHLTSLWIPALAAPVAAELVRLDELVHTLRERCPWDREQTHGRWPATSSRSPTRCSRPSTPWPPWMPAPGPQPRAAAAVGVRPDRGGGAAVAHLEEELGDLLFQVYFHATLAAEEGRFTLADVARGVHDKLVSRHPHVFGDVVADTPEDVAANWEALKKAEKDRSSVTEGIPAALPALALAAKLQRKALAVGMVLPAVADEAVRVADGVAGLRGPARRGRGRHRRTPGDRRRRGSERPCRRDRRAALRRWSAWPGCSGSIPRRPCGRGRPGSVPRSRPGAERRTRSTGGEPAPGRSGANSQVRRASPGGNFWPTGNRSDYVP